MRGDFIINLLYLCLVYEWPIQKNTHHSKFGWCSTLFMPPCNEKNTITSPRLSRPLMWDLQCDMLCIKFGWKQQRLALRQGHNSHGMCILVLLHLCSQHEANMTQCLLAERRRNARATWIWPTCRGLAQPHSGEMNCTQCHLTPSWVRETRYDFKSLRQAIWKLTNIQVF